MTLTVEDILNGTRTGRMQSVGHMGVIPILDDGSEDDTFAPPDVRAGTTSYGVVDVENPADRPTIIPTGAGWVVDEMAQDHAVPTAKFVGAKKKERIEKSMCIQETQGGLISKKDHNFVVLPVPLRTRALAMRHEDRYNKLWEHIREFNHSVGVHSRGNVADFVRNYKDELDQFVAQFELLPGQVGAIVLLDGTVVGIERAPNQAFWASVWEPLIRMCYGALSIKARRVLKDRPPKHRVPLSVGVKSLAGIGRALNTAKKKAEEQQGLLMTELSVQEFLPAGRDDDHHGSYRLKTVANRALAGQVVVRGSVEDPVYASLCAAGA